MKQRSFLFLLAAILFLAIGAASAQSTPDNANSPLGTNLVRFVDWSVEWAFVDAFKESRPWTSGVGYKWDDGRPLNLDENGWVRSLEPDQIARTLMFTYNGHGETYPGGRYLVLYDGDGTIEYKQGARKNTAASKPGCDAIDVDPSKGGIQLNITKTNPEDYIRNIRVIMPGGVSNDDPFKWTDKPEEGQMFIDTYEKQLFQPIFLNSLRKYKVLRFMNWQITNEPLNHEWIQRGWPERAEVSDAQWTRKGVPVEMMCELANRLHADPWFCMHHLANDEYIENFAKIVREKLAPDLKVYVEHSNEVWNNQYPQAKYAREIGLSSGLSDNKFQAQMFYHSERSVQIFKIWERVFEGTDRLVRVMATQAANAWTSEQTLEHNDAYKYVDAIGIAPYFSLSDDEMEESRMMATTPAELLQRLENEALPRTYGWIEKQAAVAAKYKLQLVAYEGGQHLVWGRGFKDNDTVNALFDTVNRDPKMGELYAQYFHKWRELGGGMFVNFLNCMQWGKYGRWGCLEYLTQPRDQAPKFDAVQRFIEEVQKAGASK